MLCLERLLHLINYVVVHDRWKPIQLSRGGPHLSHLAFADDLLLFAEASVDQINIISFILDIFCQSSGQRVSKDKTRIYFSGNVPRQLREEICYTSGFQVTDDLGKYLGVPLLHHRVNRGTYQFVIDKVTQRLSSWKSKTLSFAGRITLAKSVLQAIPSHVMQSSFLPRSVCDEVDISFVGVLFGGMWREAVRCTWLLGRRFAARNLVAGWVFARLGVLINRF